jgi:hypothetical protein
MCRCVPNDTEAERKFQVLIISGTKTGTFSSRLVASLELQTQSQLYVAAAVMLSNCILSTQYLSGAIFVNKFGQYHPVYL